MMVIARQAKQKKVIASTVRAFAAVCLLADENVRQSSYIKITRLRRWIHHG